MGKVTTDTKEIDLRQAHRLQLLALLEFLQFSKGLTKVPASSTTKDTYAASERVRPEKAT
jgi:hypothetical protein